ncbi:Hypothetical protein NTJ_05286 [Nesidiocoris tenuis]|uniref:Uncharacterized protein n=1 Tax=Nesidiocoris tenuis TaxID=355587 RepID=A0ABN7ANL2_9HEMI|nr:Hypothetical protein NTJ_05286 [Nesidiocoris tenuis]
MALCKCKRKTTNSIPEGLKIENKPNTIWFRNAILHHSGSSLTLSLKAIRAYPCSNIVGKNRFHPLPLFTSSAERRKPSYSHNITNLRASSSWTPLSPYPRDLIKCHGVEV